MGCAALLAKPQAAWYTFLSMEWVELFDSKWPSRDRANENSNVARTRVGSQGDYLFCCKEFTTKWVQELLVQEFSWCQNSRPFCFLFLASSLKLTKSYISSFFIFLPLTSLTMQLHGWAKPYDKKVGAQVLQKGGR